MTLTWTSNVVAVATAVGAIGTVGAVLVALFYQPLREARRRPTLSLALGRNGAGYGLSTENSRTIEPVTLRVAAAQGRDTAIDVEVLATVSAKLAESPGAHELEELDHRPLVWHGAVDQHPSFVTRLNIPPGVSREVELVYLGRTSALFELLGWAMPSEGAFLGGWGEHWVALESAAFAARPFPQAGSNAFLQEHLAYRLRFDVTARNADTVAYEAELRVRYEWKDSVMSAAPVLPKPSRWSDAKQLNVRVVLDWTRLERKSN